VQKGFLIAASAAGLSGVALGAFGAHGLRKLIEPALIDTWQTGVQYQIYHALALFMCAIYLKREQSKLVRNAAICFILGILCFSGSLYLLATRDLTHIPTLILGPVTPIGGFFFIAGWGLILLQAIKLDNTAEQQ
jgi:uncharacterized membrane protein YgdD (TMEM256/DUF423 family)